MTTPFATAKILLFIALTVGPNHHAAVIYANGGDENYVWRSGESGWSCERLGFPASDFTRNPTVTKDFGNNPTAGAVPAYLRAITHHDWNRNTAMVFDNGDRIERHGNHAFFIVNAGGANEKDFTILYPKD